MTIIVAAIDKFVNSCHYHCSAGSNRQEETQVLTIDTQFETNPRALLDRVMDQCTNVIRAALDDSDLMTELGARLDQASRLSSLTVECRVIGIGTAVCDAADLLRAQEARYDGVPDNDEYLLDMRPVYALAAHELAQQLEAELFRCRLSAKAVATEQLGVQRDGEAEW
jgi:hypothetical protein